MENKEAIQFVDVEVTRIKFEKELQEFKQNENEYRKKGIICIKINLHSINLLFAIPNLKLPPIAFAVSIDYTNWDVEPPSLKFIDPFTEEYLPRDKVLITFLQKNQSPQPGLVNFIDLLQGGNEIMPFFCIPGVREYHNHPAHSGDSWMLYRTRGEGKLCVLIEQLYKHSIAQSAGYRVSVSITGINSDLNKVN